MRVVLGIETSCDETAAAVVSETGDANCPWRVCSNVVASQINLHREWGGVVPELASRQHLRDICGVVERSLDSGNVSWSELDGIAVTQGPGLVGSLLVGVAFAKAVSASLDVPLIPVHHLAGHIESLVVENGQVLTPAVVLVVSGGHTNLYLVNDKSDGRFDFRLIGRTRDDAAGEAFDKVATLLGLGYPGGPIIDRIARDGNDEAVKFPVARMTHSDRNASPDLSTPVGIAETRRARRLEFSFSGLKTAVKRHVQKCHESAGSSGSLPKGDVADICASFQRVVVHSLLDRMFFAAQEFGARSVGIAGGVAANSRLRSEGMVRASALQFPLFMPSMDLATDNAAMIGAAGLRLLRCGKTAQLNLNATASLDL